MTISPADIQEILDLATLPVITDTTYIPLQAVAGQIKKASALNIKNYVSDELRPVVDNTGATDSYGTIATAIATATASATRTMIKLPPGLISISQPLVFNYQNPAFVGAKRGSTIIKYTGAPTNVDIIKIGDGITGIEGAYFDGFSIWSDTTMTAGCALHALLCSSSLINVTVAGQQRFETIGNKLFHGVWFDRVNNTHIMEGDIYAQADGLRVNGKVGGVGYKSDCVIGDAVKIAECAVGIRCGGGFGGLYVNSKDIIANGVGMVIDQTLSAEVNREVFLTQPIIDSSSTGANLEVRETPLAGGLLLNITGGWFGSALNASGIHIVNCSGRVNIVGARSVDNGYVGGNGDGLRVDDPLCQVTVTGGHYTNNNGFGINPTAANHGVTWNGVLSRDNVASFNLTYPPSIVLDWDYINVQRLTTSALAIDATFYMQIQTGNSLIAFDANDYLYFDRATNTYVFNVNTHVPLAFSDSIIEMQMNNTMAFRVTDALVEIDRPVKVKVSGVDALNIDNSLITLGRYPKFPIGTYAQLAALLPGGAPIIAFCSDSTVTARHAVVSGGGANFIPVYCDTGNFYAL